MKYLPILPLLILFACTSSVQTVVPDHTTVPPAVVETVYVRDYGDYGTAYGAECDTAKILELLCKGMVEGEASGLRWKLLYETQVTRIDSLQRARARVVVRVVRDSIQVPIPIELTKELASLRADKSRLEVDLAESGETKWKLILMLSFACLLIAGGVVAKMKGWL